ncbi:hypothetical protein ABIE28_003458 [Devosia sp. 2618]
MDPRRINIRRNRRSKLNRPLPLQHDTDRLQVRRRRIDHGLAAQVFHQIAPHLGRAGRMNRIFAHHICDWLVPTKDMLLDRGMMGDGVIDLPAIRQMIEEAGFFGPQEVEIFSQDNWWKRPGDEVLAVIKDRVATVC